MADERGVSYIPSCIAKSPTTEPLIFLPSTAKAPFHGVAEEKGWQACPENGVRSTDRNPDKTRSHSSTRYVEGPLPASYRPTARI